MPKPEMTIEVNSEGLDQAIEKANQLVELVELLREAQQIIDSLSGKERNHSRLDAFKVALDEIANRD